MTRKFVYLIFTLFFLSTVSCSLMSSDSDSATENDIEGELASMDDGLSDEATENSDEDIEDFDIESAAADEQVAKADKAESAYSDIENFNEGLIEDELENEEINTTDLEEIPKEKAVQQGTDEFDVETADVETTPAPEVQTVTPVVDVAPAPTYVTASNNITNLEYKSQDSGGSVVISAERAFEYQVREEPEFNQTIIEATDVNLAPRFKQPYIAKDFGQPVATINAYQEKGSNVATFIVQYKGKVKPHVLMAGNSLLIQSKPAPQNAITTATYVSNAAASSSAAGAVFGDTTLSSLPDLSDDKRLNIELDDIAVTDLIKLIADEIGFNVIVDEEVKGRINNVKLVDVPWKGALSSILGAQGLAYERKGQIVRVATVEKLTKELNDTRAKLEAEAGARNAASVQTIKVIPVSYADLNSLVTQITPVLTPSKGKVTPDMRSSSVVIYDLEENVKRAEQIIRSLDVKPIQVLIEGRIIEAKSDFLRQFGINWSTSTSPGQTIGTGNISGVDRGVPGNGFLGNVNFGTVGILDSLQSTFAIYEQEEKIKILSSPKIVTLNKEKALIKQSNQVPITTITVTQGVTQSTVSFRDVFLSIEVTPQVTFNSDIIADIIVKRDVAGTDYNGSIAINTREAQAKVLVKDGQAVVMGGILSSDEAITEGGVPWLKDIPVLGYLFKTKRRNVIKNELVIFLQPKILNTDGLSKGLELSELGSAGKSAPTTEVEDSEAEDLENELETL